MAGKRVLVELAALAAGQRRALDEGRQGTQSLPKSWSGPATASAAASGRCARGAAPAGRRGRRPSGCAGRCSRRSPETSPAPAGRVPGAGLPHQQLEVAVLLVAAEHRGVRPDADGPGQVAPDRAVGESTAAPSGAGRPPRWLASTESLSSEPAGRISSPSSDRTPSRAWTACCSGAWHPPAGAAYSTPRRYLPDPGSRVNVAPGRWCAGRPAVPGRAWSHPAGDGECGKIPFHQLQP